MELHLPLGRGKEWTGIKTGTSKRSVPPVERFSPVIRLLFYTVLGSMPLKVNLIIFMSIIKKIYT